MKTIIAGLFGLSALGILSNCTTIEQKPATTRSISTTTEQTTVGKPVTNTVETTRTRSSY